MSREGQISRGGGFQRRQAFILFKLFAIDKRDHAGEPADLKPDGIEAFIERAKLRFNAVNSLTHVGKALAYFRAHLAEQCNRIAVGSCRAITIHHSGVVRQFLRRAGSIR